MNTGLECDIASSACEGHKNQCVASGPGKDMFDSTRIIAERMATKAAVSYCPLRDFKTITNTNTVLPLSVLRRLIHNTMSRLTYK